MWEYGGAPGEQFTTRWTPVRRCRLVSVLVDGGTLDGLVVDGRVSLKGDSDWCESPVLEPGYSVVDIVHTQHGEQSRVALTWRAEW